jgi:hypothetical protein
VRNLLPLVKDCSWSRDGRSFSGCEKYRIGLNFAIIMKHRAEYKSLALNCEDLSCSPPSNLHRFRGREAQDPKDHIFGHFGLCPCSCDPHVIDYTTPKEALYTKYTRNISQKQPVSPPLGGVGRSIVLLSSWVPDYRRMQPCLAKP